MVADASSRETPAAPPPDTGSQHQPPTRIRNRSPTSTPIPTPTSTRSRPRLRTVLTDATLIVICVLIVELFIRTFVVQFYIVPSASMENTLRTGDTVVVSRLSAEFSAPRRGEIIVFRDPGGWATPAASPQSRADRDAVAVLVFLGLIPNPNSSDLVKRVIGLPGDTVQCDATGRFTVNGQTVAEPYLYPGDRSCTFPFEATVPPGCLWVEGDHRSISADSRYHRDVDDGAVPISDVIGSVIAVR